jgi:hypothetical protein
MKSRNADASLPGSSKPIILFFNRKKFSQNWTLKSNLVFSFLLAKYKKSSTTIALCAKPH